jgi:hypothetical protein
MIKTRLRAPQTWMRMRSYSQSSGVVRVKAGGAGARVRRVRVTEASVDEGADGVLLLAEVPLECQQP